MAALICSKVTLAFRDCSLLRTSLQAQSSARRFTSHQRSSMAAPTLTNLTSGAWECSSIAFAPISALLYSPHSTLPQPTKDVQIFTCITWPLIHHPSVQADLSRHAHILHHPMPNPPRCNGMQHTKASGENRCRSCDRTELADTPSTPAISLSSP